MRQSRLNWLVTSFLYIDYDKRSFIKESVLVMYYTKGGLQQERLESIPFDDFTLYVEEANRIQELQNEDN